jgi:hypothetical protein
MIVEDGVIGSVKAGGGHLLGHGVADTVGDTLSKRASSCLNTRGLMELGMPRGYAVELTELFDLIERDVESREMKPCVKEHAAMTGGENEAVAVKPAGIRRIELKSLTKEHGSDVSGS